MRYLLRNRWCQYVKTSQLPAALPYAACMHAQDAARLEKERQRASGQVQQLQSELAAMKGQQDRLRQRLQERLVAQEKAAAANLREMATLRTAGRHDGCDSNVTCKSR